MDQAVDNARAYLGQIQNVSLRLARVVEFSNHYYAAVAERETDRHAFELLINKYTGEVFPEPGANMMWNAKYAHMGGSVMGPGRRGGGWRRPGGL
ncbi:MAG: hypothetical protein JXB06_15180 [Spirochaetales bacterium]|nr:hypothetical protein [Spirochaetales bacterium]